MSRRKKIAVGLLIFVAACSGFVLSILLQLPKVDSVDTYAPNEATQLFALDGKSLARLHQEENRRVVPLSRISPNFINALIATEDPKFYQHHGIDPQSIFRAMLKNLAYGRIVEGGSTLTQQLAKNLFLSRRKTIGRKLGEAILATQIERRYTKEEILEMYCNQVYLGHNSYGIESASGLYFDKRANELNAAEAAMIVGLIRGPELYSPYRNYQRSKERQLTVIKKMFEHRFIDEREATLASIAELKLAPQNLKRRGNIAAYFIDYILQQLVEQYGEDAVYHEGLKVYTTLDPVMQIAAEEVIARHISAEGTKYHFSQAALLSIDPRTGYIKALVGGVNFDESKFNRALQAKRQPGSAFKPFVYTAAMEHGISPGTIFVDELTTFEVFPNLWNPDGTWTPYNFNKQFNGPVTVQTALEKSLNIPSIKILEQVGINSAIDVARRMGIRSHLEPGLALTLGASEVTMLEMTSAFGVFANNGIRVEPTAIIRVENKNGVILYNHKAEERQALDPNIAAVMTDMMTGVLKRGTGVRGQIGRPAAAKTGTTENFKDAWFVGFVPQLVTGVWVGNDDNTTMEGVAEVAVCPRIWKEYNLKALVNSPSLSFTQPEGLIDVEICTISNKKPNEYCPLLARRYVTLWRNSVPKEICDIHKPGDEYLGLE